MSMRKSVSCNPYAMSVYESLPSDSWIRSLRFPKGSESLVKADSSGEQIVRATSSVDSHEGRVP